MGSHDPVGFADNIVALLRDGTSFTQRDLEGEQHSVLVFFRGRW